MDISWDHVAIDAELGKGLAIKREDDAGRWVLAELTETGIVALSAPVPHDHIDELFNAVDGAIVAGKETVGRGPFYVTEHGWKVAGLGSGQAIQVAAPDDLQGNTPSFLLGTAEVWIRLLKELQQAVDGE